MSTHILVAVSGGIAAYKACDLVSKLSREYEVKVMMTPNAMEFVQPVTFAALSHHEVFTSEFHSSDPIPHIELAKWADLLIVTPASADVIAKAVHGLADNLVTSTFLACTCPKILCPAMNEHMLENPVTQANLAKARQLGWIVLDPAQGHLACMDTGKGRLPDTPVLLEAIRNTLAACHPNQPDQEEQKSDQETETDHQAVNFPVSFKESDHSKSTAPRISSSFGSQIEAALSGATPIQLAQGVSNEAAPSSLEEKETDEQALDAPEGSNERLYEEAMEEIRPLKGMHVLISAGPTQEALDPVRFLSNHSSGKQGYAIAMDAKEWGADVILVSGPVSLPHPEGVKVVSVTSARQMEAAMQKYASWADFIIMAAAVADYRPKTQASQKIKKSDQEDSLLVEFVRNPDILKGLGRQKNEHQVLCGFAMETENLDANAKSKLESKNCDMLIANNLTTAGAGFQGDTNVVSLLKPDSIQHLGLQSKQELGYVILAEMLEIWKGKAK